METKRCSRCERVLDVSSFTSDISRPDGLNFYCRECVADLRRKYKIKLYMSNTFKRCPKCKESKPLNEFGADKSRHNNVRIYCKECIRKRSRKYNKENYEIRAEASRKYRASHLEEVKIRDAKYRKNNIDKMKEARKIKDLKKPKQRRVRSKLSKAIKAGKATRPRFCSNCGIQCKPDGHHPDYDKPLDVIWLCRTCHTRLHAKLKRVAKKGTEFSRLDHLELLKTIIVDTATT